MGQNRALNPLILLGFQTPNAGQAGHGKHPNLARLHDSAVASTVDQLREKRFLDPVVDVVHSAYPFKLVFHF